MQLQPMLWVDFGCGVVYRLCTRRGLLKKVCAHVNCPATTRICPVEASDAPRDRPEWR